MKEDLYNRIVDYIVSNQEKFYRLAYSYVHNQEDAMDIVQNAVCKALDHYEAIRNENAVKTQGTAVPVSALYRASFHVLCSVGA